MIKTKNNTLLRQIIYGLFAIVLLFAYFPNNAFATGAITARRVVIGSSLASASTTYAFTFTVPTTTTAIQSVSFAACTTASGTCTPASGFSSSSSTLTTATGLGGSSWVVNTSTSTQLAITESGNAVNPSGSQAVTFGSVTNPSSTNSTFFMRITTYSAANFTSPIDAGVVAGSTAGQITVTASVDEALTFALATATVGLNTLTTSTTGTGTSTMSASTNGSTGYSISYSGTTLTSGSNTITAMSGGASTQNSKQFGVNLMLNTTPAIGATQTGTGTGAPATGYGTANSFKFLTTGDVIASATVPTNSNTFTASYIANIDAVTAAGFYSTIVTYVATANF